MLVLPAKRKHRCKHTLLGARAERVFISRADLPGCSHWTHVLRVRKCKYGKKTQLWIISADSMLFLVI